MIRRRTLVISIAIFVGIIVIIFSLTRQKVAKEPAKPKVAIVIDDWGYNLRYLNLLKQIEVPVTISILPNLRYSSRVAEEACAQGKEVILHLPLEPETKGRDYIGLEQHTITTEMSKDEIIDTFERAFSSLPYIKGVSNHMGSRATTDSQVMSLIFGELKKRKLFFLDNLVTDKSICKQLAKKMRVKFASRDIFLDNSDNAEYIKGQFSRLIEFAKSTGYAVGIGHAKPATLKVFKDMLLKMQDKGIDFVFVSDLVK